ncbi:AI-2E family transporter [Rhizobiaceae bacterium n13]|uniref:AI-2E family transporter n=1 Tax=Ferirhizobium litorale TaxID=2927786 RepID=A0AAE3QK22_9HYPH|nr:AI-2E family transporter [Fererhizobium litorale]MDI7864478.1 AI-2E family transporter [Fererhizobium litorale]MDI7924771.1 AI-2E family transporter [Fererhizobium litorale]
MENDPSSGISREPPGVTHQATMETRITDFVRFGVVALFAYWSFTLVAPFVIITIWAAILVVALYPVFSYLRKYTGGGGRLAAFMITIVCLAIIIGPLAAIALNFADAAYSFFERVKDGGFTVPAPPAHVRDWPVVGERIYQVWLAASANLGQALQRLEPSLLHAGGVIVSKIASIGFGLAGFVVSVIIAGFLFRPAPTLGAGIKRFAHRIAGEKGVGFVNMAAATIRNVARGVIGVALIQTFLAGVILTLFGFPAPSVIAFLVLIFCIVQIGPALVLLPVVIWAWTAMDAMKALAFTLLLIPLLVIDNVMKPILVARGLSTPTLIILMGVIGGTLSYGLIGLFLGPIVLSVFYELLVAWIKSPSSGPPIPPR